jgi:predicted alpha-1,6-mannanase (GH76 family)
VTGVGGGGTTGCGNTHDVTFTYTQSIVLPALALFAESTGNATLLLQATTTVDAVIEFMSYDGKVLHEPEGKENGTETEGCDQFWGGPCRRWAIFKGIFMRNLADFIKALPAAAVKVGGGAAWTQKRTRYVEFVQTSAVSAWTRGVCPNGAGFSYDWSGSRKDFQLSCNSSDQWTNLPSSTSAALDLFDAAAQIPSK